MDAVFVQLSLPPLVIGVCAAVACALPGNFLLLRRQAMLGDAVAHVVLPGLVLAFVVTGSLAAPVMIGGALGAALLSVALIEAVRRLGRIEPGAAMGAVFTTLFAIGVVLLEVTGASGVHLDVEHALMGNLESLIWFDATGWASLLDPAALAGLPPQLGRMAAVLFMVILVLWLLRRPLAVATFDEGFARATGQRPGLVGMILVALSAAAAVTAFEAVGAIIVIAMFTAPPAAARLLTGRLWTQVRLSALIAAISAILGYVLAGHGPLWFGIPHAVSAAGMIAVVAGIILAGAAAFGPHRRRSGAFVTS
ncbi:ABC-type Mn2+/Zn2+ transport system, permease component [Rubellimicrobium thermophilum DSM 16684]|uniref:ABC-type Mn2+/Zn2+ transport system, permease component n=1 Tax=Rubellimicrobium thermophilum DSM 16684 TaxID=1123069 RepID=S9QYD5_9RHOB|nr:metal ABC transporter permease [Rubellimicrobium thermophilum]EPX86406.1 ABC-type Mn2+/Zn2+ transport system, permease component [Rubellimicrobium thermophilum DSM 16684]